MSTFGKSQQVGIRGEEKFCAALPQGWQKRKQSPDLRRDFIVELFKDGEPAGIEIYAQVKSSEKSKKRPAARLSRADFEYLTKLTNLPTFIFIVFLDKDRIYFADIRQQSQSNRGNSILITANDSHFFTNTDGHDRLESEIRIAWDRFHATRLSDSREAEERRLARLDPRISVEVEETPRRRTYHLRAKEPIVFGIRLSADTPEQLQKDASLFEQGHAITLRRDHIQFENMPILESLKKEEYGSF